MHTWLPTTNRLLYHFKVLWGFAEQQLQSEEEKDDKKGRMGGGGGGTCGDGGRLKSIQTESGTTWFGYCKMKSNIEKK